MWPHLGIAQSSTQSFIAFIEPDLVSCVRFEKPELGIASTPAQPISFSAQDPRGRHTGHATAHHGHGRHGGSATSNTSKIQGPIYIYIYINSMYITIYILCKQRCSTSLVTICDDNTYERNHLDFFVWLLESLEVANWKILPNSKDSWHIWLQNLRFVFFLWGIKLPKSNNDNDHRRHL